MVYCLDTVFDQQLLQRLPLLPTQGFPLSLQNAALEPGHYFSLLCCMATFFLKGHLIS